jgi:hypothetical protein
LLDKNVEDWTSANPDEEGVKGAEGDNNRTKDDREGEADACSPAMRVREFDQVATKPLLQCFVTFSDAVDSNRAKLIVGFVKNGQIQRT